MAFTERREPGKVHERQEEGIAPQLNAFTAQGKRAGQITCLIPRTKSAGTPVKRRRMIRTVPAECAVFTWSCRHVGSPRGTPIPGNTPSHSLSNIAPAPAPESLPAGIPGQSCRVPVLPEDGMASSLRGGFRELRPGHPSAGTAGTAARFSPFLSADTCLPAGGVRRNRPGYWIIFSFFNYRNKYQGETVFSAHLNVF